MPNLYGVANAPLAPQPAGTIGGTNVSCPGGSETNIIASTALISQSAGVFFLGCQGMVGVLLGATPPSALTLNARYGTGADFTYLTVPAALLVASATLMIPVTLFDVARRDFYVSPGVVSNISLAPSTQTVTALSLNSYIYFTLYRGPDI